MTKVTDQIYSFFYRHIHCFVLKSSGDDLVAFDTGWPSSYFEYARGLKEIGYAMKNIKYAIASHYHMDHAGLVGEMIKNGITCLTFENQPQDLDLMEKQIQRSYKDYVTIDRDKLVRLESNNSKDFFRDLGIDGQIIKTPGHSPDSVSFVSGDGIALVGDLYSEDLIMQDDLVSRSTWTRLRKAGARRIFPSHAPPYNLR